MTIALIAANVAAFLWQIGNPSGFQWSVQSYGAVPAEILGLATRPVVDGLPRTLTLLSSMFLHAGIGHIGFNMLYLWIFGNNIEDALGRGRFVLFYLACGTAAAAAHIAMAGPSRIPMVGASGAIAGVLGAYLVLFPRARVLTLIPFIVFFRTVWLPAKAFLLIWFGIQLLSSFAGGGGVAWFAHIGGFVAGVLLVKLLQPAERAWSGIGRADRN